MAAPTIAPFWDKCTEEQYKAACDLIERYREAAVRHTRKIQRRYPGEDVEPRVMMGLYKAAFSFDSGKACFLTWLEQKILGECSMLRSRFAYKEKHHIVLKYLDPDEVDNAYSYRVSDL